jgi:putrescine transport system permease protein
MSAVLQTQGLRGRLAQLLERSRRLVIAVPSLWLGLFFVIPLFIVVKISLAGARVGRQPYAPLLQEGADGATHLHIETGNYLILLQDTQYWRAFASSIEMAGFSTLLCLLIGYPMAYVIARSSRAWRNVLLMLVILPFWTSFLLRVYAWMGLLRTNGLINQALLAIGLIDEPLAMLQTDFAVYIGIVYSYLPFMILPLYTTLEKLDGTLLEAAADLGSRPFKTFLQVTLPLSMPGVIAGSLLVFIPAVGEYVIPALLGGPDTLMIGRVLWNEFFANRDWPVASAVTVAIVVALVLPIMILQRYQSRAAGESA